MERNPQFRYTLVTLLVEWDPVQHDPPIGWDWTTMLNSPAEVVDYEDKEEEENGQAA